MIKKDRILVSALIVWTFIHSYLILKTFNNTDDRHPIGKYKDPISLGFPEDFLITSMSVNRKDVFYPFTKDLGVIELTCGNFELDFYDYTEFFVYVFGAWGLFFIYKLLYKVEEELK